MLKYLSKEIRENHRQQQLPATMLLNNTEQILDLLTQLDRYTYRYSALKLSMYKSEIVIVEEQRLIAQQKFSKLKLCLYKAEAKIRKLEEHLASQRQSEFSANIANQSANNINAIDGKSTELGELADLKFSTKIQAVLQKCTSQMISH